MLGSLRARMIVSFAVVVALAVFLAGAGALFLLRDRQDELARERYGRHAEPLNELVASRLEAGETLGQIKELLALRASALDVRLLLMDEDLLVVYDSEDELRGTYVLSFENPGVGVVEDNGSRYKWTNYDGDGAHLTLFAPPPRQPAAAAFAPVSYDVIVAIPQDKLASAWLELAPRLALAGVIALAASFAVAWFISRSISGPLASITQASQRMARGDYDVHIAVRGEDEVGRLAEAFNIMAREVNRSQRTMKDLLANVSHELKTPLTSIQGFSQAVLDGATGTEEELRESVRIIHDEANRMGALVDDLLLLGQIESGQAEMQHAHVDLTELLERTVERFQWALREGRIHATVRIQQLPPVHGDARRLEQLFSNLLQNAVRHTPPDGTVTVRGSVDGSGTLTIGVHNTGSYIPPEDLPRVFERFFQVDRARARKGGSSGLGLSIVSEIIEAHGGSVRATSDAASGTEFIVTLPAATAPESRASRVPLETDQPKRSPRKREAPAS